MTLETRKPELSLTPPFCFATSYFEDVFPHEDGPILISVITMGRTVPRVLVDQGSLGDVLFWEKFLELRVPLDQLRPYEGSLHSS